MSTEQWQDGLTLNCSQVPATGDVPGDGQGAFGLSPASRSTNSNADDLQDGDTSPASSMDLPDFGTDTAQKNLFALSVISVDILSELFAENVLAKALKTAQTAMCALPFAFPEIVPQQQNYEGRYVLREAEFWTCGFFPGVLYALLERLVRFPQSIHVSKSIRLEDLRNQFSAMCHVWSEPLRGMDSRTDTHDIGFIIMPALRLDWELFHNQRSLDSIISAARSLASRFIPNAKVIRSWDLLRKTDVEILDQDSNAIVIIDSMCNLDLLFYAAHHCQDASLAVMAAAHAETVLSTHLRPETVFSLAKDAYRGQWFSSCHVANIDPHTGTLKQRLSAQGYKHDSTWSRGQAWGILGYAETYAWTKDARFLEASCGMTEYFLHRLENAPTCVLQGRKVPLWDFDAPIEDEEHPLRDSSAGIIAANGMLLLSQALTRLGEVDLSSRYRNAAMDIVQDTIHFALAPEKISLTYGPFHQLRVEQRGPKEIFDAILKFGTANNNATAKRRYSNHGLIYGDYYLVEFGNKLLRMGLV